MPINTAILYKAFDITECDFLRVKLSIYGFDK